jgi:tRNA nucleotidyltransferase (CCA-adding enzyme)
MNNVTLLQSTENPSVDAMLEGAIRVFEMVFPDRIRGYYLMGSYTDGTALPTSDIDGFILFKDNFINEKEKEKAWALCRSCDLMMAPEFYFAPVGESVFNQHGDVNLKLYSLLLYGEDIREQIPLPDIDKFRSSVLHEVLFSYRHTGFKIDDS